MRLPENTSFIPNDTIDKLSKKKVQDYTRVRADIIAANKNAPCTLCIAGNGNCCYQEVQTVEGDRQLLRTAVTSGKISREIAEAAVERAGDFSTNACPMLDLQTKMCSIHDFSPITCQLYGNNAVRLNPLQQPGPVGTTIPKKEVYIFACEPCIRSYPPELLEENLIAAENTQAFTLRESMRRHGRKVKRLETLREFLLRDRLGLPVKKKYV